MGIFSSGCNLMERRFVTCVFDLVDGRRLKSLRSWRGALLVRAG